MPRVFTEQQSWNSLLGAQLLTSCVYGVGWGLSCFCSNHFFLKPGRVPEHKKRCRVSPLLEPLQWFLWLEALEWGPVTSQVTAQPPEPSSFDPGSDTRTRWLWGCYLISLCLSFLSYNWGNDKKGLSEDHVTQFWVGPGTQWFHRCMDLCDQQQRQHRTQSFLFLLPSQHSPQASGLWSQPAFWSSSTPCSLLWNSDIPGTRLSSVWLSSFCPPSRSPLCWQPFLIPLVGSDAYS